MEKSKGNKTLLSDGLKIKSENINFLRFCAALLVIFGHSFSLAADRNDPIDSFSNGLLSCGGLAVAILFFLSGLYVTASLKRSIAKSDGSAFKISLNFMKKRCDRLFPQLWAVVLLTVFVLGTVMTTLTLKDYFLSAETWKYLLNAVLIPIHNLPGVFRANYETTVNGALWTMPVEFAAYCFLAGIAFIALSVKKPKLYALAHWAALVFALAAFAYFSIQSNGFMMRVFRPVAFFMIGALYCDYAEKIVLNRVAGIIAILLSAAAAFTPILNFVLMVTLPYAIVSLCLGTKQIGNIGFIGKISYEMYLVGVPIQQTFVAVNGGAMQKPVILFLLASVADIIIAFVLFKFTELISKSFKKKFSSKKQD